MPLGVSPKNIFLDISKIICPSPPLQQLMYKFGQLLQPKVAEEGIKSIPEKSNSIFFGWKGLSFKQLRRYTKIYNRPKIYLKNK